MTPPDAGESSVSHPENTLKHTDTIICGVNPCNWAIIENDWKTNQLVTPESVMQDMEAAEFRATDLGDLGFYPVEPSEVLSLFQARGIRMMGAFVEVLSPPNPNPNPNI